MCMFQQKRGLISLLEERPLTAENGDKNNVQYETFTKLHYFVKQKWQRDYNNDISNTFL